MELVLHQPQGPEFAIVGSSVSWTSDGRGADKSHLGNADQTQETINQPRTFYRALSIRVPRPSDLRAKLTRTVCECSITAN